MNRTSRKPKIVLIALLLVIAMLCGVLSLAPMTVSADEGAQSLTTVSKGWFEVSYDKDNLEIRLSDNYRTYFDAEKGDFSAFKNALTAAIKEIAMKSILNSTSDQNASQPEPNAIAYSTVLPFAAPGGGELPPEIGDLDDIDWGDSELLKSFAKYVENRLSEPEELQKYLDGEYNTLLEYAIGEYVQNNGGADAGDEIYKKIEDNIEQVVDKAMDNALDTLAEREILEKYEDEGKEPPTEEDLKKLKEEWKTSGGGANLKNGWKEQSKEVVESSAGSVKENGGQAPSIDVNTIIKELTSISIDGKIILSEEKTVRMEGLRYVLSLIPSPAEIADMDKDEIRNLISANICLDTTFGPIEFKFTFGFFGDTEIIQKAAKALADHIDVVVDGNSYNVSIRMPDAFGKMLSAFYSSDRFSKTVKNNVFGFFGETFAEIEDNFKGFTFEEVLDFFKGIDYQTWLNDFINGDFINTYFGNYLEQIFGRRLTADDINRVINAFSKRMADFANRDITYDDALNFLRKNVPGFNRLADSLDNTGLEKIVNKLLSIIKKIDWNKYNAQGIRDVLATSTTFNDTVVSYIEEFAGYGDVYGKFVEYIEKAFNYLPDNIKNGSIIDMYDGNGEYSHYGEYTIDFEQILNKIASVCENRDLDKLADLARKAVDALDEKTFTFEISFDMNINNVYKVEYFVGNDTEKELAREGLLTEGTDVELFARPEIVEDNYDVLYWININKDKITEMPAEDTALYAVTDFTAKGYIDGFEKTSLKTIDSASDTHDLKVVPDGVSYAEYEYQWFFNGEPIEGATSDTYTVGSVEDNGTYTVEITDKFTGRTFTFEEFKINIEKKIQLSVKLIWDYDANIEHLYNGKEYTVRVKEVRVTAPDTYVDSIAGLFDLDNVIYGGDDRTQINPGKYTTTADVKYTLKSLKFEIIKTENDTLDWEIIPVESEMHTITVECDSNKGSYKLEPEAAKYAEGAKVALTVTPAANYEVESVTANGTPLVVQDGKYTITVGTENIKVVIKFKEKVVPSQKYSITVDCDSNKGSYELDPKENEYETGAQVKLTVTPAENYEVESVTANGTPLVVQDGKYTITVGTENIKVVIKFKEKVVPSQKYTITVECDENKGSYELDPDDGEYAEGTNVTLTVTANDNYAIASVTVNGDEIEGENGVYTITVGTENIEVVITFRSLTVEELDIRGAKWTVNGKDYNNEHLEYDGQSKKFTLSGVDASVLENLEFEYYKDGSEVGSKVAPSDAGNYTVKVVAKEGYTLVYDDGFEISISFVIDKYVPIRPEIEVDINLEAARGKVVVNIKTIEHNFYTCSEPQGDMTAGKAGTYTITFTYTVANDNIVFVKYDDKTYNSNGYSLKCVYTPSENGSQLVVTATWQLEENVERSFSDAKNRIIVIDENNTLPEDTNDDNLKIAMKEVNLDDYVDELKEQYPDKSTRYGSAYDISFADANGQKIEAPDGSKFRIRIPLPERLKDYKVEDLAVMHIHDNGDIEYLPVLALVDVDWAVEFNEDNKPIKYETVKCVEFEVTDFSMFVVIGLEQLPDSVGDWWLIVLLCVLGVLVILAIVLFILRARKNSGEQVEAEEQKEIESESVTESGESDENNTLSVASEDSADSPNDEESNGNN